MDKDLTPVEEEFLTFLFLKFGSEGEFNLTDQHHEFISTYKGGYEKTHLRSKGYIDENVISRWKLSPTAVRYFKEMTDDKV